MIHLTISTANATHQVLKDRLEDMSVARKIVEVPDLEVPVLQHNLTTYRGLTEIHQYLDEFSSFLVKWYQCLCD